MNRIVNTTDKTDHKLTNFPTGKVSNKYFSAHEARRVIVVVPGHKTPSFKLPIDSFGTGTPRIHSYLS